MEAALKDPFRCLVDGLLQDFHSLNSFCLQLEDLRRKKEASENRKWKRIIAKVTGKDTLLTPPKPEPYQDKIHDADKKLEMLDAYFNDMKRRYLWVQSRIAEQNICWARSAAALRKLENPRGDTLSGQDSDVILHRIQDEDSEDRIPSGISIGIDEHLGLELLYSKCDGNLETTAEDAIPKRVVEKSRGKRRSEGSTISNHVKALVEEEATEADSKMHIIALLKEIEERDEYIGMLNSQLQIKQREVTQMTNVIQRERLGMR